MPNDAKLGLLAGVIGVIAVAVVSAGGPTPRNTPAQPPTAASSARTHQPALAANTQDTSPQFPRTRPEPDGTPTSHQAHDEDQ